MRYRFGGVYTEVPGDNPQLNPSLLEDGNPFSLDDDTQMPPESPKFAASPIVLVEPPLVSNIPIVELRVVTRRAAKVMKKTNMTI